MSITTGMTIEQVREQFDLPRLAAFNKYCENFPPQHILIATYFGFPKEKPKKASEEEMAALMSEFAQVQR